MDLEELRVNCTRFVREAPENRVTREDAIRPDLAGMMIFADPLIGAASAEDPLFENLRNPAVIHPEVMLPRDWLGTARTVISLFLPFTDEVRTSNALSFFYPSDAWLHSRIEGQMMVLRTCEYIKNLLNEAGYRALVPAEEPRFRMLEPFRSNWSERHVAFIAGLGTFSLSRGLITEKGVAGRFGSIVTDCPMEPVLRPYSDPFQYCTLCGACARNCPAGAIDPSRGIRLAKSHPPCSDYLDKLRLQPHGPHGRIRYGCGKCQTAVPCQSSIPKTDRR